VFNQFGDLKLGVADLGSAGFEVLGDVLVIFSPRVGFAST
jgi:hypothetical protein